MKVFLAKYSETGVTSTALKAARVSISTLRRFRETVPEFDEAVREAGDEAADALEQEAYRRAREGIEKPVFQKGIQVGVIREYSDVLLMFLLRARRPDKYRESRGIGVKTPDGTQIIVFETGPGLDSLPWGDRNARMPEMEMEMEESGRTEENKEVDS